MSEIEQLIRRCLADTSTGVREQARGAFWAFDKVWPRQAASILDSLDSTAKKQLEKANPKSVLSAGGSAPSTPNRPRQSSAMAAMIAARRAKAAADKASSTNGSSRAASPNASPSAVSRTAGVEAGVPDNAGSAKQAKATIPSPAGAEGSPQPVPATETASTSSPPDVDALALGVGALGLHQNNGHAAAPQHQELFSSASSSPPNAPEASAPPSSTPLLKAPAEGRPTVGHSRLASDPRKGLEQRHQPLGVENQDTAHVSQPRRRVSAQSEKRLSTHSVKSDKSRSSAQLAHPPRVGQRATVVPTPVVKTNAASSQASSRSRSSSLARTLSHSPPSLLDSMPRALRHSDMRDTASSDTSAGGSHLRTPTLPRFHLPRSHPEPIHYPAESPLPPHRGVASRHVSDSVNTTPFARRRSFVPDGPVDPADEARRAQVAQGLSAAQQLLDFDDDQMDLATAPITPARPGSSSVSIAQPFRTPVTRQRQIWEDSPRAMTPRLLHDLKSRAHERSWWKERQKCG